jgi:hypothetical protein
MASVGSAGAQTPAPDATVTQPAAPALKNWRHGMAHVPPAKSGCFTSAYPDTQWREVPCSKGPAVPFLPASGPRPATVGDGNDVIAGVTSSHISLAEGSFDSVSGVTSVTSMQGSNDYSLQLNTNVFSSPVCSSAGTPAQCTGWQQFIFSQDQCSSDGVNFTACAFMQYWLIHWGKSTCPSGFQFYNNGGDDECYANSSVVVPPRQTIANLGNLAVIGEANVGGMDAVIFSTGSNLYMVQGSDSMLGLTTGWTAFEYNLVGDCCGSAATLNTGAAITIRDSLDNGALSAPTCATASFDGFTAETNNLNFATASAAHRGTSPALVFTESSAGNASSVCNSAAPLPSGVLTDTHDFDANGASDIAWRNSANGQFAMWMMSNGQMSSGAGISQVPSIWSVVGTRDLNGDGHADVLWLDQNGNLGSWLMNGTNVLSQIGLGNVGTAWKVVGTGDFNGDGTGDILWRNTSGETAAWLMSNGQFSSGLSYGIVPAAWSVAGTGDFNGDGTTDILWRNTSTGDLAIWLMKNGQLSSGLNLGAVPLIWSVVGTGDFDGDGTTDILWRDSSGNLAIWLMGNGQMTSGSTLSNVPLTWSVADTGDFDGDGKSDILWLDSSGNLGVWLMNGLSVKSPNGLGNVGTSWAVQGQLN